ncbi:MAG: SHOCT domain-containing protein [Rhodoferax sp.]
MWGGNMMGWGGGGYFGFMPLLFLGLLIVAVVMLVRPLLRTGRMPASMVEDRALSILKERYKRGEIDKAEFDARKHDLLQAGFVRFSALAH